MAAVITKTNTPPESHYTKNGQPPNEYDFIIVGGGTAGCLVANRLSKEAHLKVLLIEAGGVENDVTEIPAFALVTLGGPTDWKYKTVPQKHSCKALKDNVSVWNRGKVLGGTSVLNFMFYVRGHKEDFDKWEREGATGWSYKDVLPYFKSIENFTVSEDNGNEVADKAAKAALQKTRLSAIPFSKADSKIHLKNTIQQLTRNLWKASLRPADYLSTIDPAFHGHEGEVTITHPVVKSNLSDAFLESCKEIGYDQVDYNGDTQRGCSRPQLTIKDGRRVSASKAFIRPVVANRSNLHVSLHSFVKKITFDTDKKATGVVFEKNGIEYAVKAAKEIILSAGTIGTPHILLLSGVGPKTHLKDKKINLVADLPVGENLQDHVGIGGLAATTEQEYGLDMSSASSFIHYGTRAYGPLATPGGEVLGFMSSTHTNDSYPDVELLFASGSPARPQAQMLYTGGGLQQTIYDQYYLPNRGKPGFMIIPVLNRPKSTGTIKLNTSDPRDYPIIDPKYYSHEEDIKVAAEAAELVLRVMNTTAMRKFGTAPWSIPFPGCSADMYTKEYLKCLPRQQTLTGWHYVGTCKMGCDDNAVVDPWLRVRGGVKNLRVVDGSIMPTIVTGNVLGAIYMIAAKGADMILQDHELPPFVQVNKQSVS
ncbi:glucose dehydrogenase [FAD, quinone]-like [Ornithodoros turicata]|uniref:glucose dehydrogenase [FAD, quinone]-like n=1 Tax=Ornithodoros turicata TaxID=34597 RepID=UPI00313A4114